MPRYFIVHKPYGVLSQFTREIPEHRVLGDLFQFPSNVYPVGRLDRDSEGLLIVSDDKKLNNQLLNPKFAHQRTYWVQVDGQITPEAVQQLTDGVTIRINKKDYHTKPAQAALLSPISALPERDPPIRFRKNIPTSWISLSLTEGKNRQVRRMCAKVGFPVLRLIRMEMENLRLQAFIPGKVVEMSKEEVYAMLF
ncbi:MAG: pseudouridine synthase [Bacteroidota bacterium]